LCDLRYRIQYVQYCVKACEKSHYGGNKTNEKR